MTHLGEMTILRLLQGNVLAEKDELRRIREQPIGGELPWRAAVRRNPGGQVLILLLQLRNHLLRFGAKFRTLALGSVLGSRSQAELAVEVHADAIPDHNAQLLNVVAPPD